MSFPDMIAGALAAGRFQRIPAGVSGFDPVTRKPWASFDEALAVMERSRAIAARVERNEPITPRKRRNNWATPEKDALIRKLMT